ncbi:Sulfotransferase family protein [Rosistilla ulvae]|uniref:Sulfotransferase family protein n=2 Tax=Rosistilla ulvae TaxID=1930277 RepID=A0A517LX76_9BACT|nr:Sulfotransferase family protein [Rosistilla ulvae]
MGHYTIQQVHRIASSKTRSLPSFSLTRNPWARLFSAYRFAIAGRGTGGTVTAGIRHPKRYQKKEFGTFDSFIFDWLRKRNINKLDGVFRLQSNYVCDNKGRVMVDHLGRLEDLDTTYIWLAKYLGASLEFPHSNRSGTEVNYREHYNSETARIVGDIYAEDVERFRYKF